MRAVDHYTAGEQALGDARAEYVSNPTRAQALAGIAAAEFAAAAAATALAGPHRDPVLDAVPLPHAPAGAR